MNVELRIKKIERLLTDVSQRRSRVAIAEPPSNGTRSALAGWDRLERGFTAALLSAKRQQDTAESG